ncbi:ATP-dependent DNA helicase Hrp3, partial [Linderina pennispora]
RRVFTEDSDANSTGINNDEQAPESEMDARPPGDVEDGELSEPESMDERACKDLMRPVKRYLQRLRDEAEHTKSSQSKVKLISDCLLPIGRHIRSVIERKRSRAASDPVEDVDRLYRHLWVFVTYFWRSPVNYKKLVHLFERLEESSLSAPPPPALSPTAKHQDSAASPTSSRHRSHGRSWSRSRSRSVSPSKSREDTERYRKRSLSRGDEDEGDFADGDGDANANGAARRRSNGSRDHRSVSSSRHHHHHRSAEKPSSHSNGRSQSRSTGLRPSRRESRRQH